MTGPSETKRLLRRLNAGDDSAFSALLPLLYQELHGIAARLMANERSDHTLQPTALIHDAWLRLVGSTPPEFDDRRHFLRVSARAMRRVLVDHARGKNAQKRGGGAKPAPLHDALAADALGALDLVALDEALDRLGEDDPQLLRIVELRYFAGLTLEETGEVMGLSNQQVYRAWSVARGRLRCELGQ